MVLNLSCHKNKIIKYKSLIKNVNIEKLILKSINHSEKTCRFIELVGANNYSPDINLNSLAYNYTPLQSGHIKV